MALVYLHCFATITTIHLRISRIFSSSPTETLYPLNTNFPSSSQSLWQPPFYSLSLYEFDYYICGVIQILSLCVWLYNMTGGKLDGVEVESLERLGINFSLIGSLPSTVSHHPHFPRKIPVDKCLCKLNINSVLFQFQNTLVWK